MSGGPEPVVSVIVCTYNRPETLPRAIDSVLAQDYANYEIIVVDDGSNPPARPSSRQGAALHWLRTEHRGVGAARAAGLDAARGPLTAYCDDDEVWTPNHLSTLVRYLDEHPDVALVYGDSESARGDAPPAVAYSIAFDGTLLAECNYIFANDVVHRTEAARRAGGFDSSLGCCEDWDLWLRMSRSETLRHLPAVVGSRSWHEGRAAADYWQVWETVYRRHQERLRNDGEAARHGLVPDLTPAIAFNPETWGPARRELIWHSLLRPNEGYGSVGRQLLPALERQGVVITVAPTTDQPPPGFERFFRPLERRDRLAFYYHYWARPSVLRCERVIQYSMWESTRVPAALVEEINRAVALQYVPCRQNLESFRECGVRVPLKVLHHGVDPDRFPYLARGRREPFTFGTFGDFSPRKGIDVIVRAFRDEFAPRESVRLLLKSSSPAPGYATVDPRIIATSGFLDQEGLLDILSRMDAFVLSSRGEGFGLCGLEAMATGLPVIATDWGGPVEYLDPIDSFPLAYRLVDAGGVRSNNVHYHGCWAEPDYEHLRHLLRRVFEHPDEAADKGEAASGRVHKHWGWDRVAGQLCRDLDEIARL